jgi:acyl-CoA synthetase (AMP-forming)/AMP-acid ligase II
MGPGYFVIAILGCADGGASCAPVATVPTHYTSESACSAAAPDALIDHSDLDFPTLVAECRSIAPPVSASRTDDRPQLIPAGPLRS